MSPARLRCGKKKKKKNGKRRGNTSAGGNPQQEDPTSALSPSDTSSSPSAFPPHPFLSPPPPLPCIFGIGPLALISPPRSPLTGAANGDVCWEAHPPSPSPIGRAADAIRCHTPPAHMCLCMCGCVCVCARIT